MSPAALDVAALSVAYGAVRAVDEVSFTLERGSMLAVTGPSGAGKSSLLWAIAGALTPAGGEVRVRGTTITARQQAVELGVALIPQGNGLAALLTAWENLVLPLLACGVSARDAHARAGQSLAQVGLEDNQDHLLEELSGGQQQRVAVARALALRPSILLADEPTSDVDSTNRARIVALLREQAAAGAAVVMTTHDAEAAQAADLTVALDNGRMRSPIRRGQVQPEP